MLCLIVCLLPATVPARSAVARFRGADGAHVEQALNVGGVINGTVRRFGDRLGEYVALALTLGVKMITSDKEVLKSFPDVAVSPEVFKKAERN